MTLQHQGRPIEKREAITCIDAKEEAADTNTRHHSAFHIRNVRFRDMRIIHSSEPELGAKGFCGANGADDFFGKRTALRHMVKARPYRKQEHNDMSAWMNVSEQKLSYFV